MSRRTLTTLTTLLLVLACGCSQIAIWAAPGKEASTARTALARKADALFWTTLNGGAYDDIPAALRAMTAAYVEDPNDAVTAARVGWLRIWRIAERARLPAPTPGLADDAALARKYFEEAVRLNPSDGRYRGFYASALMLEGTIHKDEKLRRQGYFALREAVAAWPEFNLFTAGYVASGQPHDSERFHDGLAAQWRALDVCHGETVDRHRLDYARLMARRATDGPKRVCWNSAIAPHNVEGFLLNLGDMLVKAGEPDRAIVVYGNARHAPEYATWPYRAVLEDRMRNAPRYVERFRAATPAREGPAIMFQSRFACVACHQR
jgi:hypothetical protein